MNRIENGITEEHNKILLKLDEYSKLLGITIYDLTYGFIHNGEEYKRGIYGFNVNHQNDIPEYKGFVECLKYGNNHK